VAAEWIASLSNAPSTTGISISGGDHGELG
jgi:hypothetical protein